MVFCSFNIKNYIKFRAMYIFMSLSLFTENTVRASEIYLNPHKMKSNQKLIAKFKNFVNEEILSFYQMPNSYTNIVFQFTCENGKYIFKQHLRCENNIEDTVSFKIQQFIGTPAIIKSENKFTLEEYIENVKPDFFIDLEAISLELRKFHKRKYEIEGLPCIIENFKERCKNISALYTTSGYKKILHEFDQITHSYKNLCHFDLQINNILKTEQGIVFIDFEYAGLGSPWLDIANLFCETMTDYNIDCKLHKNLGYQKEEKVRFLQIYTGKNFVEEELANVEKCVVFSHFFWYVWAKEMIYRKKEEEFESGFDYEEYSKSRLNDIVEMNIISQDEANQIENILKYFRFQ